MAFRSVWARWGPWRGSGWGRGVVERVQGSRECLGRLGTEEQAAARFSLI
jgi:hypothetical protein